MAPMIVRHCWVLVLTFLGSLSLASCSTPAQVGDYPNQRSMIGKSKSAILACAGTPKQEFREGETTFLRYYREAPILEESRPMGKGSFATIRHGCWATVALTDEHVVAVHYRFVPPTFDASNDCEDIFESCLQ